jgi:hypothetical protein
MRKNKSGRRPRHELATKARRQPEPQRDLNNDDNDTNNNDNTNDNNNDDNNNDIDENNNNNEPNNRNVVQDNETAIREYFEDRRQRRISQRLAREVNNLSRQIFRQQHGRNDVIRPGAHADTDDDSSVEAFATKPGDGTGQK